MKLLKLNLIAVLLICTHIVAKPNPPEGFQLLFNGKDLQGWYGNNPHETIKAEDREQSLKDQQLVFGEHWSVVGNQLVNDGHGPYATTEKDYGDIELLLEYKTVALADSGIYLRGTPQVQIWDTTEAGGKWKLNAQMGSGGLFNNPADSPGKNPLVHADKPFGEWNAMRIKQVGDRTWVWLNGALVVDGAIMHAYFDKSKPLPTKGPIHLQTHGGEIRWRNLFIREIGAEEARRTLANSEGSTNQ
ncbi:3-keto-disaccharide hydrolase [Pelagicoccus mobilis]|uniref:DUF1080 domain-containing protein n=1 Tax=Pelagicoccus mobilis TaxID=415221 RepID=A0A934S1K8_9BACT|nr:DUF1080 domain-containing protein [Pelagicoccus mobilis]MBK1877764.1 DUF1080 domain-containing protein [Pelagicoccus mobilis]